MNSIVIKHSRGADGVNKACLVHRTHDMTGTDYQGISSIDFDLALEMGREGIVLHENDTSHFPGKPGLVFCTSRDAHGLLDVRRDVDDPKTSVKKIRVEADLERYVLSSIRVDRLKWLYGEPQIETKAAA